LGHCERGIAAALTALMPGGRLSALYIQPEMLAVLTRRARSGSCPGPAGVVVPAQSSRTQGLAERVLQKTVGGLRFDR
jgi:hypothetical protein